MCVSQRPLAFVELWSAQELGGTYAGTDLKRKRSDPHPKFTTEIEPSRLPEIRVSSLHYDQSLYNLIFIGTFWRMRDFPQELTKSRLLACSFRLGSVCFQLQNSFTTI
jgi:hypothetical protein